MAIPDPRIAAYVAEIELPGVPYINRSATILYNLCCEHGADLVYNLLEDYWEAKRQARILHTVTN